MFNKKNKILVLAPHMDDIELGMSGTLLRISNICPERIMYISFSRPPNVDKDIFDSEFDKATSLFRIPKGNFYKYEFDPRDLSANRSEILQILYDLNIKFSPDIVFLPNSRDIHQSHKVIYEEGIRVFKNTTIFGYELPWNNFESVSQLFVVLNKEELETKKRIISSFKTQKNRSFFSNDVLLHLSHFRGKQIGRDYAEAFEVIRLIIS